MIKNVSFFMFAIFLSAVSFAQISTFYQTDSVKIKGIVTDKPAYKLVNYDNDGFWSRLDTFYINYDDDLNILNSFSHKEEFDIKLNGNFYSLKRDYHDANSGTVGSYTPNYIVDSVYLQCYNPANNTLTYKNLPNQQRYMSTKVTYLKSKNAFAVASNRIDTSFASSNDTIKLCLTIIDTAGNVLKYREYDKPAFYFSIVEQGNNIVILSRKGGEYPKLYVAENVSLDLIDSIDVQDLGSIKPLNDSIIIISGFSDEIGLYNMVSKTSKHFPIRQANYVVHSYLSGRNVEQDVDINFINEDSIFFIFRISLNNPDHEPGPSTDELGFQIVNFSHNVAMNFATVFNDYQATYGKIPRGMVCTQDGGIIITVRTDTSYGIINNYLLKLDFNGGISGLKSLDPKTVVALAYPNPTKDFININCSSKIENLDVYNAIGQKVYSKSVGFESFRLDVSHFEKGNYILKIQTPEGETSKKIIVE